MGPRARLPTDQNAFWYHKPASLLLAIRVVNGVGETNWGSAELWASVAWIGPIAGLATILFFASLKHLPAARASAWLFLVPTIAVLLEVARGKTPGLIVMVGMCLTILGVGLVNAPQTAPTGIPGALSGRIRTGSIRVRSR